MAFRIVGRISRAYLWKQDIDPIGLSFLFFYSEYAFLSYSWFPSCQTELLRYCSSFTSSPGWWHSVLAGASSCLGRLESTPVVSATSLVAPFLWSSPQIFHCVHWICCHVPEGYWKLFLAFTMNLFLEVSSSPRTWSFISFDHRFWISHHFFSGYIYSVVYLTSSLPPFTLFYPPQVFCFLS